MTDKSIHASVRKYAGGPQTPATEDRNYSSTESHRLMAQTPATEAAWCEACGYAHSAEYIDCIACGPDPQTPATEAGRRLLKWKGMGDPTNDVGTLIIAIEAEARAAEHARYDEDWALATRLGRADALREAADAVRAEVHKLITDPVLGPRAYIRVAAVLAILDPQP